MTVFTEGGLDYVEFYLHGKTKPREAIGRSGTIDYLKRIHARTDAIKHQPFDVMLKTKMDLPVFCLPDGTVTEHLRQTFKAFLKDANLLKCPKTGQDRTLYSLRHTSRVSDLLCMSNLAHASKLKEHDNNDDIQGRIRRAAERR